jgi:hypothetical protein
MTAMSMAQGGHGLGVDELLTDLEAGQEGRGIAVLAGAVEELLDAGGVAGGDDQRRAMVVTQQQRQIGGRAGGRERHCPHPEVLDPLQAGGVSVGVGGQHHLRATQQHVGADLVRVADDELRPISRLAQDICAGADAHQDGLVLLDERFERLEVVSGVGLLGDDHHMSAVQVDLDIRDADTVDQQRALAADELDGVSGERFEVGDQSALRLVHQLVDFVVGAFDAEDEPPVAGVDTAVVQPHPGAVLDLLEDLRAGLVDQRDPVGYEHLGPEVGVATRDRRRGVDDCGDVRFDQRVGGYPVEVKRVDDDDVAGSDATQQPVDVAVHAGRAGYTRP